MEEVSQLKLDDELLLRIANWKPAVSGWPDDVGDALSLAQYRPLISDIESLPVTVRRDDGWQYADTFFGLFLYHQQSDESFEGLGLYVSLCRFAPIGIYGEERRAWGPTGGYASFPTPDNMYCVSDPNWQAIAEDVRTLMENHSVYLPTVDELARPIGFPLPQMFRDNANQGRSIVFDILFNDLY